MTDLLGGTALEAIQRLLRDDGHAGSDVLSVESLWERRNVLRVHTTDSSVVVKIARVMPDGQKDRGTLQSEAAALAICNAMPTAIAPRLIGFDGHLDIVVMEDLPSGRELADFLLLGSASSVEAALTRFSLGLATLHAGTARSEREYLACTADLNAPKLRRDWLRRARGERGAALDAIGQLVSTDGLEAEVDRALNRLETTRHRGLVHGDLCPDNILVTDGGVRIVDFEASSFGPIALDAAYLLAPFPSCWCFAALPQDVADSALGTYQDELARLGVLEPGDELCVDIAAALACYLIAWLGQLPDVLLDDEPWGTTTMRPRILRWLASFERYQSSATTFPKLTSASRALLDALSERWPDAVVLGYPSFAPVERSVEIPSFWTQRSEDT
jgi:Ser/Thr protein kinase RdoA (MazF antagonist)